MTSRRLRAVGTVFRREVTTVVRTPGYWLLSIGLLAVLSGVLVIGGGGQTGFIPAIVDLLVPTEVLVPLLAVVLGYRALLADAERGELAVIRTYPVSVPAYVCGVLLGRILALLAVIGPFALLGGYIWLTASPETGIYATHAGVDSPIVYVRFLAFVWLLGVTYLAAAMAAGTLVRSRRGAIAIATLVLVGGVLGGDLVVMDVLRDSSDAGALPDLLAMTPNGAFRGLVLEYVIGVAFAPESGFISPGRAIAGLVGWTVAGIATSIAVVAYGSRVGDAIERLRRRVRERENADGE